MPPLPFQIHRITKIIKNSLFTFRILIGIIQVYRIILTRIRGIYMKTVQTRNYTLDVMKLISSFFIVFIHVPFHGIAGEVIRSISRFAVPVFFMTSGFFSYENDTQTILRRIKKLAGILIFASCLYNTTDILSAFASSGSTI